MSEPERYDARLQEVRPLDIALHARLQQSALQALGNLMKDLAALQTGTDLACDLIGTIFGAVGRCVSPEIFQRIADEAGPGLERIARGLTEQLADDYADPN